MDSGHEVEPPATDDGTPLPIRVDGLSVSAQSPEPQSASQSAQPSAPAQPTAASVLQAIAAAAGPWFPAKFATEACVPRDSLDDPLAELRLAGLVKVAEWVRGVGQGYVLTPEGEAIAADAAAIARLARTGSPVNPGASASQKKPAEASASDEDTADENEELEPQETELGLRPPLVVPILLMANSLWFFVCATIGIRWGLTPARALSEGHPDVLHRFGAVTGMDLVNGEWWRLLSCCFVHIGAWHLVINMLALAMMGPLAELLWGRGRLLLIYLISGLAGSALAMTLRPDSILAGASGAIWGIQMSLFAWLFAFRQHLPPDLVADWFRRLCVVFVLNAAGSFLPGVSWEGHLGGGVAGFLVAGLLNAARFGDRPRRLSAWLLLALLPVLCIAGVAAAMDAKGMPGWQHLRQRLALEQEAKTLTERQQKLREAQNEFNKEVAPLLEQVAPFASKRLVQLRGDREAMLFLAPEATVIYSLTGKRSPEATAAHRQKVESLKSIAETVVQLTTREPVGIDAFDQHRERARAFAAARVKSFEQLLNLLNSPGPPTAEALAAWQSSSREADRLWAELVGK